MTRALITGAAGFLGAHTVDLFLAQTDWDIVGVDSLKHRGDIRRVVSHPRYSFHVVDLACHDPAYLFKLVGKTDYIFNLASESHVDRSIAEPVGFVKNNVDLMLNVLEYARLVHPKAFIQCSTDEVFGSATLGACAEWDAPYPSNPYSASKAAQDMLAISYQKTYGLPVLITHTMNLFGEMQHHEKYVAKLVSSISRGEKIPIWTGPDGESGKRCYLYAKNVPNAWLYLLRHVRLARPQKFNVPGDCVLSNLDMAIVIAEMMGKTLSYELVPGAKARPGYDAFYLLDGALIANLGWRYKFPFRKYLQQTIEWTLKHPEWMKD